jgi:uncharacterized membrane protein YsdA (DUF1294 family)/cold shock CspA family protein
MITGRLSISNMLWDLSSAAGPQELFMRTKGKITSWDDEKGFGFITPLSGGKQVFVHISAFRNRKRRPEIDQVVTYAMSTDKHGRPCAGKATLAGDRLPENTNHKHGSLSLMGAGLFFIVLGTAVITARIHPFIFVFYLVASLLTFFVYAADKSAAIKGTWRTQESTLHLLALVGGWPGAIVAQQILRHKSKKQSFRAVFWITVFFNGGGFAWLLTPSGSAILGSLFAGVHL